MTDDMPKPRRPFLRHERNRHGNWCWYVRRGNKRIRLPDDYGSAAFWDAYDAALAGEARKPAATVSGSLEWLVARYKESARFTTLAPSSQYFRDRFMRKAVERSGHVQFVKIAKKHIQAGIDERAKTPHEANNFLIAMNQLFTWAVDNDHIEKNPCDGVSPIRAKIVGHHTWTMEEIEQYKKRHPIGTRPRLAIDLLLFTGFRISDLIRAGKQHVRGNILSMKTGKTGATVHLTIFADLKRSIDATQTGDLAFLIAERGRPFAHPNSFARWFSERCVEAGMPKGCSSHGLRKAGATIAADGGASPFELMAMYGWSKIAMAEVYTKEANKRRLASSAGERIANAFAPHLETERAAPTLQALQNKGAK